MNTLHFLSPGRFMDDEANLLVLHAFADLYHRLTPKHQRKIQLCVIEEPVFRQESESLCNNLMIAHRVVILDRNNASKVEDAYRKSGVFIYPSLHNQFKIISEALRFGLPILSVASSSIKDLVDHTCSMLLNQRKESALIEALSLQMEMLYFDREAFKLLKRGALKNSAAIFKRLA